MPITIAVDAMGGDHAPGEIVAGAIAGGRGARRPRPARRARRRRSRRCCPAGIRGVELVRDHRGRGDARSARVGAHQEGLVDRDLGGARARRQGRRDGERRQHGRGDGRRAAAHGPHPRRRPPRDRGADPGAGRSPQTLVDGGATVDCTAEWLRQFAIMGREYARWRMGVDEPRIGLLSNGEEAGQGRRPAQGRLSRCSSRCRGSSATSRAATSCTTPST